MPKIVDTKGNEITLTPHQKNQMYHKAKELRERIKGDLLTKSEHWNPSKENVDKYLKKEGSRDANAAREMYKKTMEAIGADPRDISTERLRKGR